MLAEFVMVVVGGLKFGAIYSLAALGAKLPARARQRLSDIAYLCLGE